MAKLYITPKASVNINNINISNIKASYYNNSLYINSFGIRTTIGGNTPHNKIEYLYYLINNKLLYTEVGFPQYFIKNFINHKFYTIFINVDKINKYIKSLETNNTINTNQIKYIYLVNDINKFADKSPNPDLHDFKLNCKFSVTNNKLIIPDSIVYNNTD